MLTLLIGLAKDVEVLVLSSMTIELNSLQCKLKNSRLLRMQCKPKHMHFEKDYV
jgi:hypothetical protein